MYGKYMYYTRYKLNNVFIVCLVIFGNHWKEIKNYNFVTVLDSVKLLSSTQRHAFVELTSACVDNVARDVRLQRIKKDSMTIFLNDPSIWKYITL